MKINNKKINGVVLSDQIKSLDWETRKIECIAKETPDTINAVIDKIGVLLFD